MKAVCAVRCYSIQVTMQSASSSTGVLGINFAPVGFQRWSFASGRASDWRQSRRERKECEKNVNCTEFCN